DALGRRRTAVAADGTTTYRYDLVGQLANVDGPHGSVDYRYDGFGRLVARLDTTGPTYHLVGIDGHRLVDVDGSGRVLASYLWLGEQCIGRVDGPLGGPLAATFHRDLTGRPLCWADETGRLHHDDPGDAFGGGATLSWD